MLEGAADFKLMHYRLAVIGRRGQAEHGGMLERRRDRQGRYQGRVPSGIGRASVYRVLGANAEDREAA